MMKTFKKATYLILTILVVSATGCSKDDSTSDDGGGNVGRAGDPHSYDIKITAGENAGFEMSGKVSNEDGLALYAVDPDSEYKKSVIFSIGNEDMGFSGSFHVANNGDIINPDNELWILTSHDINKSFFAKDVSITVSNIQYKGLPETGYASFKLKFAGTYYQNINENDIYEINGTVIVNFPPM